MAGAGIQPQNAGCGLRTQGAVHAEAGITIVSPWQLVQVDVTLATARAPAHTR